MSSSWSTGAYALGTSMSVFDLLPELSAEEKARLPSQGCMPERQDIRINSWPTPIGPPVGSRSRSKEKIPSSWSTGAYALGTSTSVFDPLPELSAEEKARLPSQGGMPERQSFPMNSWRTPMGHPTGVSCMRSESSRMRTVCDVLSQYNAEHPGGEFDAVKPLMEYGVSFRRKPWLHMNFWARSRSNNNIKRFFAEVRFQSRPDGSFLLVAIAEACTIIEESFSRHRTSCAFCPSHLNILHPVDDHDFVCGNGKDKDWIIEEQFGMRFIRRVDLASPNRIWPPQ